MIAKQTNNRFKTSRINAGYTQRDVQKIIGFISYQALSQYEKGIRVPSNKVLYSLPRLYKVSLDYLLCQDDFRSHHEFIKEMLGLSNESIQILIELHSKKINITNLKEHLKKILTETE